MNVFLPDVGLGLGAISNLQRPGLIIRAVGTGHEFLVLALEREPRFKVILLRSGIVQGTGHNGHDPIGYAQRLVEFLGRLDHLIKSFPRVLGLGEQKLFDLETVSTIVTPLRESVGVDTFSN